MNIATWDDINANLDKAANVYNNFTYDTETDGGILTKLDEVAELMNSIETCINDIGLLYNRLDEKYDKFTDFHDTMQTNETKLKESLKAIREKYRNLISDMKFRISELQKNDKTLIEDLTGIYNLLGECDNKLKPSPEEKIKEIYPKGPPSTPEDAYKDIVSIDVPITTKDGIKKTTKINVNKAVAEDVKKALQVAQDAGFKVYDVQGFNWKGDPDHLSQHSYGLAIDINIAENPCVPIEQAGADNIAWKPNENEYSIGINSPIVQAFEEIGWSWGGYWSTKKDYMHFSFTNS
jgi:hypothetical protein